MDIPILKYVDILIGLAVVIFLGATIVASLSQFLLWWLHFRSRTLRNAIEELLADIDPALGGGDGRSIAERLLRHPLLGQQLGPVSRLIHWIRRTFGGDQPDARPLVQPADVIQRHELAMCLIEWAAGEGPLAYDRGKGPEVAENLGEQAPPRDPCRQKLETKIAAALAKNGVADPARAIRAIRGKALQNEREKPGLAAHLWTEHALLEEAPSEFLSKIHTSFDNAMRRATDAYAVRAKTIASIVALGVAFIIQLDALALVRRLAVDEGLRDSLVEEAKMLTERIDNEITQIDGEIDKARAARQEIDATLALLRQPKYAAIPETLIWQKLARGRACPDARVTRAAPWKGTLRVGPEEYPLSANLPLTRTSLEKAILDARAPVYLYYAEFGGRSCLEIVARAVGTPVSGLGLTAAPGQEPTVARAPGFDELAPRIDWKGVRRRLPGVLFSWLLLSLGAPFWFDLLKGLLKLRSVLADKDDKERSARETRGSQSKKTSSPELSGAPRELEGEEAGDLGRAEAVG